MALKTTPLYDEHLRQGAKMINCGHWLMPVQYSGIVDEHLAVRSDVGLFDISHMGQFIVSGPRAAASLNCLASTNRCLGAGIRRHTPARNSVCL